MTFLDALGSAGQVAANPSVESGYYGRPKTTLDPRLVDEKGLIHMSLRKAVLERLYAYWEPLYRSPQRWSKAWIAGSAPSYQWREAEDLDLDILIGVDWDEFYINNPAWRGVPRLHMAEHMNTELRERLWGENWPAAGWETTFFVNPQSYDIRDINPYAAFNLTDDRWDVRPVVLPQDWDPDKYYPQSWTSSVGRDAARALQLIDRWNARRDQVMASAPNSPARISAMRLLLAAGKEAADFFDEVHYGRKEAFSGGGEGYYDFANYRWQASKHHGWNAALRSIRKLTKVGVGVADIQGPAQALIGAAQFSRRFG